MNATTGPSQPSPGPLRRRRWFRLPAAVRRGRTALNASEPDLRTVWVVLYTPVGAVGNTFAVWTASHRRAESLYLGAIADSLEAGRTHRIRLIPWRTKATGDAILDEVLACDDPPAAREFRP
jgi:hypothetical protein